MRVIIDAESSDLVTAAMIAKQEIERDAASGHSKDGIVIWSSDHDTWVTKWNKASLKVWKSKEKGK